MRARFTKHALAILVGASLTCSAWAQDKQPAKPGQAPDAAKPKQPEKQPDMKDRIRANETQTIALVPSKWLDDNSVRGLNDEKIGEVKDLILNRLSGRVSFVLLGHGGVATIGEKVTAVPFTAFGWNADKKWLTLPMTAEQLKSAPTLDSGEWKSLGDPTHVATYYGHYKVTEYRNDRDKIRDKDSASKLGPEEHRVVRVSDIRGKTLMGSDGREVGTVNDLVLDANSGRVAFVAVTFGGVMGIGSDKVAVPWSVFDINKDGRLFVTDIDKETIKAAPRFKESDWGELRDTTFGTRVYKHYGKNADWLEPGAR